MDPEELAELPVYFGFSLIHDRENIQFGRHQYWLHLRARHWMGRSGCRFMALLDPISFATHETGVKVLHFARDSAPRQLSVTLDEQPKNLGPFTRTIERQITVSNGATEENFSAGWMASSIIRHGEKRAAEFWLAELKQARLLN